MVYENGDLKQAPTDDHGVMSRRTRRGIARIIAVKAFRKMNRLPDRKEEHVHA